VSAIYRPEKSVWTEDDFHEMGWHDTAIHAIAFPAEAFEIAFDIDYIFKWIKPAEGEKSYRFWISPATLVFWNVIELSIDLSPQEIITLQSIDRRDPGTPRNAEYIERDTDWRWTIDGHHGEITFRACGFNQFTRLAPLLSNRQILSDGERGGFSIERPGEWIRQEA
jgi:hypothetical protein